MSEEDESKPTPKPEWVEIQQKIAQQVIKQNPENWPEEIENLPLTYIGGLDISYEKNTDRACVTLVVLKYTDLTMVYENSQIITITEEYVPNYLSFREKPFLIAQVDKLKLDRPNLFPQLFLVDGNGILHKDRAGLACQFGVYFDVPTIGVAKNEFFMDGDKKKRIFENSDRVVKICDNGEELGAAVITRPGITKPLYISIGHRICLETAIQIVLRMCVNSKQPEPTRMADIISRQKLAELVSPPKATKKRKDGKNVKNEQASDL